MCRNVCKRRCRVGNGFGGWRHYGLLYGDGSTPSCCVEKETAPAKH
jgi:hypothetical protein